jgi:hypothetical protein
MASSPCDLAVSLVHRVLAGQRGIGRTVAHPAREAVRHCAGRRHQRGARVCRNSCGRTVGGPHVVTARPNWARWSTRALAMLAGRDTVRRPSSVRRPATDCRRNGPSAPRAADRRPARHRGAAQSPAEPQAAEGQDLHQRAVPTWKGVGQRLHFGNGQGPGAVVGPDIGKATSTVCVRTPGPRGGRRSETRTCTPTTRSLVVMRDWLSRRRVPDVSAADSAQPPSLRAWPATDHRRVW